MFDSKPRARDLTRAVSAVLFFASVMTAYTPASFGAVSPLTARGYSVLPIPQNVTLTQEDFVFTDRWQLIAESRVQTTDIVVQSLKDRLAERCHLQLSETRSRDSRTVVIRLSIRPGAVTIGDATDRNKAGLAEQAYQLGLKPQEISLRANAAQGLFYGKCCKQDRGGTFVRL